MIDNDFLPGPSPLAGDPTPGGITRHLSFTRAGREFPALGRTVP